MKILVVGGGGREHTLVWKIVQSPLVDETYAAPGNAGIAQLARCVPLGAEDLSGLADFAQEEAIDLTVVGPELPLVLGIVDEFERRGLKIFGPSRAGAEIEGSKVFCKELLRKYAIPTANFEAFDEANRAIAYIERRGSPIVVKADGLAAGKGSIVATSITEAVKAVEKIMVERVFGEAGERVVVEEFLEGEEASILALTDGEAIVPLVPSQDHKRVLDGDQGPNTGGMGAYAPAPVITGELAELVFQQILQPTIRALNREGRPYKGVLYAGLMVTSEGPKVLEFNCRFGDPESQVVLPLMEGDLVEAIEAVCQGRLHRVKIGERPGAAVCVVLASGGYPGPYEKGKAIKGLDRLSELDNVVAFHAGTALRDGELVTNGGRVLGITGFGRSIIEAIERTYGAVELVYFEGMHFRRDIGHRALRRLQAERG